MAWLCSNGGPTYWADGAWATWPPLVPGDAGPGYPHGGAANNWSAETPTPLQKPLFLKPLSPLRRPLKGSKASNWEGGTRGAAFMSGGFLPPAQRGKKLTDYIHITDWFSTFCFL